MTEAAGAPPSEKQDDSAQVPAQAGKTEQEPIDLDRALNDEDYLKEVNERLAQPEEQPKDEPKEEIKAPEAAEVPLKEEDPDPVIEKVIFRGQEREVRRSKQKELLQKGILLDTRLEELSPMIRLSEEAPEVVDLLRTPEGRQKVIERIRQKTAGKAEDDLPEIEGYDKDDVKAVDRIVNTRLEQRLKALGIRPEEAVKPDPAVAERVAWKARVGLEGLRTIDPEFEGVYAHMGKVLSEAERTIDPKTYKEFVSAINNPEVLNKQTGRPAFMHFYDDVRKDYLAKKQETTQPAVPRIETKPRQETSARLAPGAATNPAVAPTQTDWSRVPQSEFDKAFAEALARG